MTRGSLFWGIVLILFGLLFILSNLGYITFNVWQVIGPVILILLGVWVLFGAVLGRRVEKKINVPLDQVDVARIKFEFAAGKLTIKAGSNPANLLEGELSEGFELRENKKGSTSEVKLSLLPHFIPFFWIPNSNEWDIELSQQVQLSLEFNTGACDTTIDLTGLKVKELNLNTGASSTNIIIPSEAVSGKYVIKAGLASVNLRIPPGIAARIKTSAGLGAVTLDQSRFIRGQGEYRSQDYDTAQTKIDLAVEVGLGAVDIR